MQRSVPPFFYALGAGPEPGDRAEVEGEILGHDLGCFLVVTSFGAVVAIDPNGAHPPRLVNSSASSFEATMGEFESWYRPDLPDGDAQERVEGLREALRRLDPQALRANGWWPLVLEQIEIGLL